MTSVGSCLAVYSAGMAVGQQSIGMFCAVLVLVGTLVSYIVRVVAKNTSLVTVDGIVYGGAILLAVIMIPQLNAILPDDGFPKLVIIASTLCWMLILGSFCMWRDGTLLFQAIPSIALFGLIGCYDTYRNVTFAFFGFLICLATLFARAHTREMLQQAVDSGYFGRAETPGRSTVIERSMALYVRIKEGPWRWLAGPEWALASALIVVLVSLLGAPIIRESAQQFSGFVKIPTPPQKQVQQASILPSTSGADVKVGQGAQLSETPVYEVAMDQNRYLRAGTYDVYTGDGWRSSLALLQREGPDDYYVWPDIAARQEMKRNRTISFSIRPLTPTNIAPTPGEVIWTDNSSNVRQNADGTFQIVSSLGRRTFRGRAIVADPTLTPREAITELPSTLIEGSSLSGITDSVKEFARGVARGKGSDYDKALSLKRAIEERCMYNVRAKGAPPGRDVAEYFLFEQRQGYCDSFATAMVLMARSVGIPARYVSGYLPESANRDAAGRYVVLQKDAHAWAELFFKNVGWVVFDATEGAEIVPGGSNVEAASPPWFQSSWFSNAINVLLGIAAFAAIALVVRMMRPPPNANQHRADTEDLYVRFTNILQRRSHKRRDPSLTPDEFLELAKASLNGSYHGAHALNDRFVFMLYGPDAITDEDVARLRADLREFEEKLRKEPVTR